MKAINTALSGAFLLAMTLLTGCVTATLAPQPTSYTNVEALRTSTIGAVNVGSFKPASTLDARLDREVSARGNKLQAPAGSFSALLRDYLVAELKEAARYDPSAAVVITGELTQNHMDALGTSEGEAKLSARFVVTRSGQPAYDKVVTAERTWPSSFVGMVAVPAAFNEYSSMYRRLLGSLYADAEFIRACSDQ
jgi:hypothetical protein